MNKSLKKIVHFFILSCPQATLQIEKELSAEITIIQRLRLKYHLLVCKWCYAYKKKSILIHRSLNKVLTQNEEKKSEYTIDKQLLKKAVLEKIKKI